MARQSRSKLDEKELREYLLSDLTAFARAMNPGHEYGVVHEEVFNFWSRQEASDNQLVLLPRGHKKSHCLAVEALWELTREPELTMLYISATSQLAEQQLFAIKQMMESDVYMALWPEMINEDVGKRVKWTTTEIIVDHPRRREENIKDFSVAARGLTSNITGLHADRIYLDDMVVPDNAYTEDGRDKVAALYSQLSSIANPGAKIKVVGTRYHPRDLYSLLLERQVDVYDDEGNVADSRPLYEVFERKVEVNGEFLWPRQKRSDGKQFGFDQRILAQIRAGYLDVTQFFAQYYNDPNDPDSERISYDKFQYYDRKYLECRGAHWYFKNKRLNLVAAIDFAFSLNRKADYTAIVVIGIDEDKLIYVLDIDRFKTDKISEYYSHILALHNKWGFRKLRAEVTVGQKAIVKELKESYFRPNGIVITVEEHRPSKHAGSKEERMSSVLEPRYDNMQIFHYKGGNCALLEEEVVQARPAHDDIKDALTCAIDAAVAPSAGRGKMTRTNVIYDSRFGGVSYR